MHVHRHIFYAEHFQLDPLVLVICEHEKIGKINSIAQGKFEKQNVKKHT